MDLTLLAIFSCVFIVSLITSMFVSKLFKTQTFEDVAAEKKLLANKLYGTKTKKHYKLINKKSKEKKQKSRESSVKNLETESLSESDAFVPDTTEDFGISNKILNKFSKLEEETDKNSNTKRKSLALCENKRENSNAKMLPLSRNKSEDFVVKDTLIANSLSVSDNANCKGTSELKNLTKEVPPEDVKDSKMNNKEVKKIKQSKKGNVGGPNNDMKNQQIEIKSIKVQEKKPIQSIGSPKVQNITQKKKKTDKLANEKNDSNELMGVSSLIKNLSRTEMTRNEIQMLIDYLLNKQQDSAVNHSEWSDDIVQKLRRQLNEKEKALQEEQEASMGIQAKLRALRLEINSEKIKFNSSATAYLEDIQSKKNEILNLNLEIQNITEKFNLERQKFQTKLRHEKQACSQEYLSQIQQLNERNNILQNENVQKNTIINEIKLIAKASHQAEEETRQKLNEIIQQQSNNILSLEKTLKESDNKIAHLQYELEHAQKTEKDKENDKVEILNLQNALDSAKAELNLTRCELNDSKKNIENFKSQIENLNLKLSALNQQCSEQNDEISNLNFVISESKKSNNIKETKINECEITISKLYEEHEKLKKEISDQEQKNIALMNEKWKLISELQNIEIQNTSVKEEDTRIRELFKRLYPEAASLSESSAFSLPLEQWIEQVMLIYVKQLQQSDEIGNKNINIRNYTNNHTQTKNISTENDKSLHSENEQNFENEIFQKIQMDANLTKSDNVLIETSELNDTKHNLDDLKLQIENLNGNLSALNEQCVEQKNEISNLNSLINEYQTDISQNTKKANEYELKISSLCEEKNKLKEEIKEAKQQNLHQNIRLQEDEDIKLRKLITRLFPEAVKFSASSDLSLSLEEWIEQVLIQLQQSNVNLKSYDDNHTQTKNNCEEDSKSHNSENDVNLKNVVLQNTQLQAHMEELSAKENIITQTRKQEAYWQKVAQTKEDEINSLKNLNSQAT